MIYKTDREITKTINNKINLLMDEITVKKVEEIDIKKLGILYFVIISSFVISIIMSLLTVTNLVNKTEIKKNSNIVLKKAILNAFQIQYKNKKDIIIQFDSRIKKEIAEKNTIYSTIIKGHKCYAIIFSGNGLLGTINGVLAIDQKLERIIGVEIISHREFISRGSKINNSVFKKQFTNEKIVNNRIIVRTKDMTMNHENGEINAISGATKTSKLFGMIINDNLLKLRKYLEHSK